MHGYEWNDAFRAEFPTDRMLYPAAGKHTRRSFLRLSIAMGAGLAAPFAAPRSGRADEQALQSTQPAGPLGAAEFRRLFELLAPPAGEPWQAIPWKVSLNEARRQAVEEGRPLLMLSRSGHPLGCT